MSVATTYAEALYEAADAQGVVPDVAADLRALRDVLTADSDVARVLLNPEVETKVKKDALEALSGTLTPLALNFARVLLDRGRLEELPEIVQAFERRVSEAEGRIAVEVITAVPLTDDLRERIVERVQQDTGRIPEVTESVDPDIIGGLVLRVGGVMIDNSVRGRLDGLRRTLEQAPQAPAGVS